MSFEQVDFDHYSRFDNRMLGSVGNSPHTNTGPSPISAMGRPQLSLVPSRPELDAVAPATSDDQWQERASDCHRALAPHDILTRAPYGRGRRRSAGVPGPNYLRAFAATASFSAVTLSVFSHGNPSRPKCP